MKVDLGTDLRDKHGNLFVWYLELFWPSFKVGQTNVEKMHFCPLSQNWVLKVDLGTHLRDKHRNLFLRYLDLFWPLFKVGQTKVENIHFCWLFHNWNLKVDLATHLNKQACTPFFATFRAVFTQVQPYRKRTMKFHFWPISQN